MLVLFVICWLLGSLLVPFVPWCFFPFVPSWFFLFPASFFSFCSLLVPSVPYWLPLIYAGSLSYLLVFSLFCWSPLFPAGSFSSLLVSFPSVPCWFPLFFAGFLCSLLVTSILCWFSLTCFSLSFLLIPLFPADSLFPAGSLYFPLVLFFPCTLVCSFQFLLFLDGSFLFLQRKWHVNRWPVIKRGTN
jgi:hypothetical protein